jgi:benzodiazapine receptor
MIPQSAVTPGSEFGRSRLGRVIAFVAAVSLPLVLGGAGGVVTAAAIPGWYAGLSKPPWNPPSWVFGPVWTTLYFLMGVSSWRVWKSQLLAGAGPRAQQRVRSALVTYSGQLALNAVWSPVFFGLKRIDLALVVIVLLLVAIIETIRRFAQLDRPAAVMLLPYLGWVSFATILNATLLLLNR